MRTWSRRLIRAGANANAANRYGVTPLSLAAAIGDAAVVEALIAAGARPPPRRTGRRDGADDRGADGTASTPFRCCWPTAPMSTPRSSWYGQTALMWAAAENHAAVVQALDRMPAPRSNARSTCSARRSADIADFRTDKNGLALQTLLTTFPKQGLTPLLFAARQGALDAVRALADAGRRFESGRPRRHHADDPRDPQRPLRRRRRRWWRRART